ncbi:universal stress protein [Halomicroarcula limicola]|uniref:Universal stress protein n=1 Tax=Haloarcula limicola TaxID=1429915 RepID=A0A8J8C8D1_9EURY|nr:universal stress protein [Halomicroarcula limicola]MBV0925948.1 universal stress protein [Halomicroarcula limicola]
MLRELVALDTALPQANAQAAAIEEMVQSGQEMEAYLLHVFDDNPEGASVSQVEAVRETKDRLEELGVEVELLEASGSPQNEILRHAEEYDVDQICVGGRKRSPTGKALFGSVTQAVILGTNLPVLVCGGSTDT